MKAWIILLTLVLVSMSANAAVIQGSGQFVGSKNSNKYHYPSCYWAQQIHPENQIWFATAAEAVNKGYVPCKVCNPPLPQVPPTPPPVTPPITPSKSAKVDIVTTVGEVIDGDTFHTANDTKIRFADIDAPETYEAGYLESKNFLASLVNGKSVYIDIDDINRIDTYGRYVCLVLVEWNSTHFLNVNKAMVDNGEAALTDYTNNEFNPYTWTLYYSKSDVSVVPELPAFALLLMGLTMFSVAIRTRKRERVHRVFMT